MGLLSARRTAARNMLYRWEGLVAKLRAAVTVVRRQICSVNGWCAGGFVFYLLNKKAVSAQFSLPRGHHAGIII
jgi:hypothetical protein